MDDFLHDEDDESSPCLRLHPPSPSPADNTSSRSSGLRNSLRRKGSMVQQQQQADPPRGVRRRPSNFGVGPQDNLVRIAKSISVSVEMFATVGETIGDESADIRGDMADACREARSVSSNLEKLCEEQFKDVGSEGLLLLLEPEALVRVLRCLLAAVTRVLLLADNVVVKQLLMSKDVMASGSASSNSALLMDNASLKTMHNFTEFVKAFCDFGADMVQIVHVVIGIGDNQEREERRKAQVDCARLVLERSATLLLTSSKTFICYPNCPSARENRDTVFCQMRRALDLIHYIIKEGVVDCSVRTGLEEMLDPTRNEEQDRAFESTVLKAIRYFEESVEIMRMSPISDSYKDQLSTCLASIVERTQDFTDSAYTNHEHRQNILLHCDRAKVELNHLQRSMAHSEGNSNSAGLIDMSPHPLPEEVEMAMRSLLKATTELRIELQQTAIENSAFLIQNCRIGADIMLALKESALMGDFDRLQMQVERFSEHIDYAEDVAKLIRHVTQTESAQIRAKHAQINLRIYGPQVAVAASTLCRDVHSKVAQANLETFCVMWQHLIADVIRITEQAQQQEANQQTQQQQNSNLNLPLIMKQPPTPSKTSLPPYPSSPPQAHSNLLDVNRSSSSPIGMGKFHKSVPNLSSSMPACTPDYLLDPNRLDPHNNLGVAMEPPRRHSTSSVMPGQYPLSSSRPGEYSLSSSSSRLAEYSEYPVASSRPQDVLNSYKDVDNNEIVKRSKKMAQQAEDMFNFTRGQGKVRTTQDLFTLAEALAEEANVLYKVIRVFSYDVPSGEDKRFLMAVADNVPKHCHQLQMLIQSPIVGKAATFTKVDSIIKEARQIMQLVLQVVQICFVNANKYNLDFSNISLEGRCNAGEDATQPFGSSSGSGSGNTSGNDSS